MGQQWVGYIIQDVEKQDEYISSVPFMPGLTRVMMLDDEVCETVLAEGRKERDMKPIIAVGLLLMFTQCTAMAEKYQDRVENSRSTVNEFMQSLKGELQAGMQQGGPVNAIGVCKLTAPGIASTYRTKTGWDVGRTSLRVRNPDNAPDDWETGVLNSFEKRKAAGESVAAMEFYEVTRHEGEEVFRYMKAIPILELCTVCHGEQLDPEASKRISELYPHDQATGFRPGDIRGAFTIIQPLASE